MLVPIYIIYIYKIQSCSDWQKACKINTERRIPDLSGYKSTAISMKSVHAFSKTVFLNGKQSSSTREITDSILCSYCNVSMQCRKDLPMS